MLQFGIYACVAHVGFYVICLQHGLSNFFFFPGGGGGGHPLAIISIYFTFFRNVKFEFQTENGSQVHSRGELTSLDLLSGQMHRWRYEQLLVTPGRDNANDFIIGLSSATFPH